MKNQKGNAVVGISIAGAIIALIVLLFVWPQYRVWQQGMSGQARLAEAQQSKQIAIETAKAELESAQLRAQAIKVIGETAKQYPEYRNQEFIGAFGDALRDGKIQQIVYVPTEANIPILEAGKRPVGE
ncbi:hypothetical protein RFH42_03180 [Acinetobacter rudis]|uniref:hypothetical protein n=1 Tax=Acinetobacter rudis TaxID=632955 RepID=UPI00280C57C3|nr:hypothetical protein [Acinetobacter rudis]MDQ8951957.1 hypothetical protein [Acinetobacter rudis]